MATIAEPSVKSLLLSLESAGQSLGIGTGFIAQSKRGPVLITNWHNVSGRNPQTNQTLSPTGALPDQVTITHNQAGRLGRWIARTEALYAGGKPRWVEHPTLKQKLPRPLLAELRALRAGQREERLRRGLCGDGASCRRQHCRAWHDLDLIFCQPNGKPLHGHNLTRRDLKALCAGARLPAIRMHDLRHLHNTTLTREGVNPKIVKERAGHHSVAFTLEQYSWVTRDLQEIAVEALTRSLARAPEETTGVAATGLLPDPGTSA